MHTSDGAYDRGKGTCLQPECVTAQPSRGGCRSSSSPCACTSHACPQLLQREGTWTEGPLRPGRSRPGLGGGPAHSARRNGGREARVPVHSGAAPGDGRPEAGAVVGDRALPWVQGWPQPSTPGERMHQGRTLPNARPQTPLCSRTSSRKRYPPASVPSIFLPPPSLNLPAWTPRPIAAGAR